MYPFKFIRHVTNDQFPEKFNNGAKKIKMADLLRFFHFTTIILPCGPDNLNSFSCFVLKFVKHVTNKEFSDKFDNG